MALDSTVALNGRGVTMAQAAREGAGLLSDAGIESSALDAEVLLRHVLDFEREQLYLNSHGPLGEHDRARYRQLLQQRALGKPVAYITGNKEFWSLDLLVTPDVLIPRPESELLVEVSLELARGRQQELRIANCELRIAELATKAPRHEENFVSSSLCGKEFLKNWELRIVDLGTALLAPCSMLHAPCALQVLEVGTGSGAVAISLAKELPEAKIAATDISAAALEIARTNAARLGLSGRIEFFPGNLFKALPDNRRFDFILSNPPYIRSGELERLSPEIRDWEPKSALDGGEDGLDTYRGIAAEAHRYLADGGHVALEIGADMAGDVSRIFAESDRYGAPAVYQDYAGRDRVFATRKVK